MSKQFNMFSSTAPPMPEGYYSGDRPNPNLRGFVEAHLAERPYDPDADDYDVPAFDQPIETTKATAIYNMHTYWSKKPHDAIRQYICHYTQPGDLVLDPFCGSGGTALAALMEGRKAIAIDRSPAATFITKNYCTPVDVDALQAAFEALKARVKPEIDWLYETRCDRCGGKATTAYTVYSQVFQCPRCLEKIPLFDCVEIQSTTAKGKPKKIKVCPYCHERGLEEEIKTTGEKFGAVPVLVRYLCEKGCKPARSERRHNDPDPIKRRFFVEHDLAKLQEIEDREIPYWYPQIEFPKNFARWNSDLRLSNVEKISELFTKRNLWALSLVRAKLMEIASPTSNKPGFAIWTAITTVALTGTRMLREKKRAIQAGTYYIPPVFREIKIANGIDYNVLQLLKAQKELISLIKERPLVYISTQSACKINQIQNSSIDYIFTDPPYADKVQYGELNFVWEAWLNFDTSWHAEEIIVNETRGVTQSDWKNMMQQAMNECFRALKPGRWLSLCYHDTSEGTWTMVQDIMAEAGFLSDSATDALYIDTGQKSYNQLVADKVNKRDLVINFRKPRPGEAAAQMMITGSEDERSFNAKARAIIRDFLSAHPGSAKDRVYDDLVSRMVRAGQMEAHNFDDLLSQVALPVETERSVSQTDVFASQRWYLRDTEYAVEDLAESAKEDAAARTVRARIAQYLKAHPDAEGMHYSDLFEYYIYAVKDKPRRSLAEWLSDYVYTTAAGTYRLPRSEAEEQAKTAGRQQGVNRRIKRYLAFLSQGVQVPDDERPGSAALAAWIRHCKRAGLYEQGKTLYERGGLDLDDLSEEQIVNVEEDYQVCLRQLRKKR